MATQVSLCLLTRDRPELSARLVRSLHEHFPESNLEWEVCIADNSRGLEARSYYQDQADHYEVVTDEELWFEGFSFAKNKAVNAATNPWVVVADLGEEWRDGHSLRLGQAIRTLGGDCPAFRVQLDGQGAQDLCRVFDKTRMRLQGLIHEGVYAKRSPTIWSHYARRHPAVAQVAHLEGNAVGGPEFARRKEALYDHLLKLITDHPELRPGTDPNWYTKYWPEREAAGVKLLTFDEWKGLPG